jgi:ankyrin repeat domain-containing protein 50
VSSVLLSSFAHADETSSIVFVHGLQGHPKDTWTSKSIASEAANSTKIEDKTSSRGLKFWSKKGSSNASDSKSTSEPEERNTFWPYHLLCDDCKNVRILTWGYNSNVTEFFGGSANKGTISSHSRDLLGDLTGERLSCVRQSPPSSTSRPNQLVPLA